MTAADKITWARVVLDGRKWRSDEKGLRDIVAALADLADALAQENDKLREALREIADAFTAHGYADAIDAVQALKDVARTALGETP